MKHLRFALPVLCLSGFALLSPGCTSKSPSAPSSKSAIWERQMGAVALTPLDPRASHQELNIKVDLIPKGQYGRRLHREMTPRYITIHSTQNYTGDAFAHAKALKRGALRGGIIGYLCWHFTVQGDTVIQHLPTDERGEHADFDGPGNRYSIGIEMCEHNGNCQVSTMERTAKLAANLMYHHKIPIENVKAHYHWPRERYSTPNKNCPHFLMENGVPGDTWRWFVGRINRHHQRLVAHEALQRQEQQKQEDRSRRGRFVQLWWDRLAQRLHLG